VGRRGLSSLRMEGGRCFLRFERRGIAIIEMKDRREGERTGISCMRNPRIPFCNRDSGEKIGKGGGQLRKRSLPPVRRKKKEGGGFYFPFSLTEERKSLPGHLILSLVLSGGEDEKKGNGDILDARGEEDRVCILFKRGWEGGGRVSCGSEERRVGG